MSVKAYTPDVAPKCYECTGEANEVPTITLVWDKKPADQVTAEKYWTKQVYRQLAKEAQNNLQIHAKNMFIPGKHQAAAAQAARECSAISLKLRDAANKITV